MSYTTENMMSAGVRLQNLAIGSEMSLINLPAGGSLMQLPWACDILRELPGRFLINRPLTIRRRQRPYPIDEDSPSKRSSC